FVGEIELAAASRASRTMLELLTFSVGVEEYALAITAIQEIIKVPEITELPRAPHGVLGIISLRGTIVPIVDARVLLHLEREAPSRSSRILVLRADGDPMGVLVDRVKNVVRIDAESVEPTPRAMQGTSSEFLRGVGRVAERLLIVL